ncbi:MAG TPA: P-II family nitrogen regulator [Crenotrichaceae bacterium]|nr:P-II family nitrogen regulator [Crenotrichaceae bacterium]
MKQIIAYIKPHKLENVMLALHKIEGLSGISVLEIRGCGRSRKTSSDFIFDADDFGLVTRLKLEIACQNNMVDQVVAAIQKSAHTGLRGDGKIYVLPVLDALRISTNEVGDTAV